MIELTHIYIYNTETSNQELLCGKLRFHMDYINIRRWRTGDYTKLYPLCKDCVELAPVYILNGY